MSTTAIICNVIMSLLVLLGVGAGLVAAARSRPVGDEGRASGRGPFHLALAAGLACAI